MASELPSDDQFCCPLRYQRHREIVLQVCYTLDMESMLFLLTPCSVSGAAFSDKTVSLAVAQSDMTQSISRLVTKFDTQDVDGTSAAKSGKVKRGWGKDGNVWFHISIGSFPKWLKDFAAGYRAGYNAVVAAQPFDPNNLDGSRLDSVVQASHV